MPKAHDLWEIDEDDLVVERVIEAPEADGGFIKVYSHAPLIDIHAVREHPDNTRQGDTGAVVEAIKAHGFYGQIEVNATNGYTVMGNTRLRAMLALGCKEIPADVRPLTEREERENLISDNRTSDLASYDEQGHADFLAAMAAEPAGLDGTGWSGDELDDFRSALQRTQNRPLGEPTAHSLSGLAYRIVITCNGEREQQELLDRLQSEGYVVAATRS